MRYRLGEDGSAMAVQSSGDFVAITVWFTLFVGIVFVCAGVYGRQRWLLFWGVLTCISCAAWFMRGLFGLS